LVDLEGGSKLAGSYTLKKLTEIDDSAPKFGHGEVQEARFATNDLEAERTGISHLRVKPGKRQAFAHKHENAEEIYVVLAGSGRVKLDDEIVEIEARDAIRIAPEVTRQFEAGPGGLELIACGTRHEGDGEILPGWWSD
jgi:mannose-6-phosphate isomerase-like protein (cupin superfamily)